MKKQRILLFAVAAIAVAGVVYASVSKNISHTWVIRENSDLIVVSESSLSWDEFTYGVPLNQSRTFTVSSVASQKIWLNITTSELPPNFRVVYHNGNSGQVWTQDGMFSAVNLPSDWSCTFNVTLCYVVADGWSLTGAGEGGFQTLLVADLMPVS